MIKTTTTTIIIASSENVDDAVKSLINEGYSRREIQITNSWDYSYIEISGIKREQ